MYGYNNNYMGYQPNYYGMNGAMPDTLTQLRNQPMQQQTPAPQPQPQQNSSGLIWVQGEAGAKSYLVAPNTTLMLMDSENSVFYLKSADASGMPMPLRIFEYKEVTQNGSTPPVTAANTDINIDLKNYVTRDELNEILANLTVPEPAKRKKKDEADNG